MGNNGTGDKNKGLFSWRKVIKTLNKLPWKKFSFWFGIITIIIYIVFIGFDLSNSPYWNAGLESYFNYDVAVVNGKYSISSVYLLSTGVTLWGFSTVLIGWFLGDVDNLHTGIRIVDALEFAISKFALHFLFAIYAVDIIMIIVAYLCKWHITLLASLILTIFMIGYAFAIILRANTWQYLKKLVVDQIKETVNLYWKIDLIDQKTEAAGNATVNELQESNFQESWDSKWADVIRNVEKGNRIIMLSSALREIDYANSSMVTRLHDLLNQCYREAIYNNITEVPEQNVFLFSWYVFCCMDDGCKSKVQLNRTLTRFIVDRIYDPKLIAADNRKSKYVLPTVKGIISGVVESKNSEDSYIICKELFRVIGANNECLLFAVLWFCLYNMNYGRNYNDFSRSEYTYKMIREYRTLLNGIDECDIWQQWEEICCYEYGAFEWEQVRIMFEKGGITIG